MPNKFRLAAESIALATTWYLSRRPVRTRYAALFDQHTTLIGEYNTMCDEMTYLVHKINESEIQFDEFDLIALPHITVK